MATTHTIWRKPDDLEGVEAGDRLVCVIPCRLTSHHPMRRHLFILTAEENGWDSEDGWSIEDAELWAFERDILAAIAKAAHSP